MSENQHIRNLDVSSCDMTNEMLSYLFERLKNNTTL